MQLAAKIGVAKSTLGYYENENRMPDIEILSRICNVFNFPADYPLGRTNTEADFLSEFLKHQRYGTLDKLNYLIEDFANDCDEDYDLQRVADKARN